MVAELQSSCGRIGLREMDEKEGVLVSSLGEDPGCNLDVAPGSEVEEGARTGEAGEERSRGQDL